MCVQDCHVGLGLVACQTQLNCERSLFSGVEDRLGDLTLGTWAGEAGWEQRLRWRKGLGVQLVRHRDHVDEPDCGTHGR